jgi:hypothetical protein
MTGNIMRVLSSGSFSACGVLSREVDSRHRVKYQGCQMVCFQTKNPNKGKCCRAFYWKMLIYVCMLWPF